MSQFFNTKKCVICKRKNDTLHWHIDADTKNIWVWCQGKCQRGYSLFDYCAKAGISLKDFLKDGDFDFRESTPNEVRKMDWPAWFVPLNDIRAEDGLNYIKHRGLSIEADMYYDIDDKSIVFPMYFRGVFVGAQMRLLHPKLDENDEIQKMDTLPGTRLGYLFYGWDQNPLPPRIKYVVITEGAFNAIAIQQSLNTIYGGLLTNPWLVIAASGSGASEHQREVMKELVDAGYHVVIAPDSDDAGLHMLKKYKSSDALTHYALTLDRTKDWNDMLHELGNKEFAKFFLGTVKPCQKRI